MAGRRWYGMMPAVPSGYEYVGSCLCGFGHHAFYTTPEGTLMHASQIFTPVPALLEELTEEELAQIKKRIEELEKEVK